MGYKELGIASDAWIRTLRGIVRGGRGGFGNPPQADSLPHIVVVTWRARVRGKK